jgi:hypothetical protein
MRRKRQTGILVLALGVGINARPGRYYRQLGTPGDTMISLRWIFGAAATLILAGCSSGGDGGSASSCSFVGGSTECSPIVGGCNNTIAVGDGNLSTFGEFSAESGGFISTGGPDGASFNGGTNAGVFLTPPAGLAAADITISTFLSQNEAAVESATGPALTVTPTEGDPATHYISFETSAPFNGVKMTVNAPGLGEFLIYEFCGAATVR